MLTLALIIERPELGEPADFAVEATAHCSVGRSAVVPPHRRPVAIQFVAQPLDIGDDLQLGQVRHLAHQRAPSLVSTAISASVIAGYLFRSRLSRAMASRTWSADSSARRTRFFGS